MKLDLSRRDYRSLLTVLEIADWVLHAYRTEEPQETAPLRVLQRPHANTPDPAKKLRIGYLSGDFFRHAVANFIEPVSAKARSTCGYFVISSSL